VHPAFPLVVRLPESFKDGVNSLSAAERGRTPPTRPGDNPSTSVPRLAARPTAAAHRSDPPTPVSTQERTAAGVGLLGQLLDHQEAAQVTRARAAWPLRLGWKKSRLLTWLALNE
jgi:hypothetical protein